MSMETECKPSSLPLVANEVGCREYSDRYSASSSQQATYAVPHPANLGIPSPSPCIPATNTSPNKSCIYAKEALLSSQATAIKRAIHPKEIEGKLLRSAEEGTRVLVGPMPVESFLDEFLPVVDETEMPDPAGAFAIVPTETRDEKEIYSPLISAINENGRCPVFIFVNTSVSTEQRRRGVCEPDVTVYSERNVSLLRRAEATTTDTSHFRADLGIAETFWLVKPESEDPFYDDHGDKHFFDWKNYGEGSKIWKQKKKAFGRCMSYAAEGCARQHRVSYFSVLIISPKARFLRWDRAGTVVTRAFDYQQNPKLLCRYLWRFSAANMIERGFDPTVTIASEAETQLFESVVSKAIAFQKGIDPNDKAKIAGALQKHYQEGNAAKINACNALRSTVGKYLVSVPVRSPVPSAGRSSRGYWTAKIARTDDGSLQGEVGFLKDVRRLDLPGLTSKGSVLSETADVVPNIPQLDCLGDCPDGPPLSDPEDSFDGDEVVNAASGEVQATRTQDFITKEWVSKSCRVLPRQSQDNLSRRIVKHIHFRMISKNVGYPLTDFIDARELFLALKDVLDALIVAYQVFKRLHRYVSLENVMLCRLESEKRRQSILIDWELPVTVDGPGHARDYFRSGTWAYMSVHALGKRKGYRRSHSDDLESLFYVSLRCAVRWLAHNEITGLGTWMFNFFDWSEVGPDGTLRGGFKKLFYKDQPTLFSKEFVFKNKHINNWFAEAYLDLSTFSALQMKHTEWTNKNIRSHMRIVCEGLPSENQPGIARVEHSVADKVVLGRPFDWASHISDSELGPELSAIFRSKPGRKRSRIGTGDLSEGARPQNKRARQDYEAGTSDESCGSDAKLYDSEDQIW